MNIPINKHVNHAVDLSKKIDFLDEASFKQIEDNSNVVLFRKGETIFKQGTFVQNIVFMEDGLSKVLLENHNKKSLIIILYTPGNFIGIPVMKGQTFYPYSVVAQLDCRVRIIRKEVFFSLILKVPEFMKWILNWHSGLYATLFHKLKMIGTLQMHGRLADTLLMLDREEFKRISIYKHISRKDIANLAGMSQESMNRILNELKEDKIISIKQKEIVLNDKDMLDRLTKIS
jgi:CRP/FNR family transcriptional regulator